MRKKELLAILFITFVCGFAYFYKLNSVPDGFYVDEASVAYNAFSIFKTGRDEYGVAFPIYFRLLGSYSPSLFIYISAIFIKFFGMQPVVFRSITATATAFSVFIFYLLLKEMKLFKLKVSNFVTAFFYGLSPWLFFNARVGYETTFGFVAFTLGAYFLFRSYSHPKFLKFAIAALSISTYISHNQRFLAPLLVASFLVLFRDKFLQKKYRSPIIKAFIIGLILNLPNLYHINTKAFWIKSSQFNPNFFWNILVYLSPKTLFYFNPDIDMQHTLPKLSMFNNWMAIPYLIGFYLLFKKLKNYRNKFILLLLALPLIPAVFSSPFISEQKILPAIIPFMIIIGLGIDTILIKIKSKLRIILIFFITIYSLLMLYTSYFVLFPKERAEAWQYGYDQLAQYVRNHPEEQILFDHTRNPRAYILFLYYLNYPPKKYQQELGDYYYDNYWQAPDPALEYQFGNLQVREINWEKDPRQDLTIIGDPLSISESQAKEHYLKKNSQVYGPSEEIIFEIYKTQD